MLTLGDRNSIETTAGEGAAQVPSVGVYKIKFSYKLAGFIAATMALSWFFEGWRQFNASPTVPHVSMLVFGTLSTLLTVGLMGYWTYFEEKSKGTLRRHMPLYEAIHKALNKTPKGGQVVSGKQGENDHHG